MIRRALVLSFQVVSAAAVWAGPSSMPASAPAVCDRDDGYRGIWYANQPSNDQYKYKYSGGLGTYCAKHIPLAYYAVTAGKTFFVYGGTPKGAHASKEQRTLLIMASYYDHKTGLVPRPTILTDKRTADAHDNPTIMLDGEGYVWVFAAAHGTARPAYIFKSARPYDVAAFQMVKETNFSYPQCWHVDGRGFLFLHTRYTGGRRELYAMTSKDGLTWSRLQQLAAVEKGHYQISWRYKNKVGTAFNYHPNPGGLNARTNLYYMESDDFGKTWRNIRKEKLDLPLRSVDNKALVYDYQRLKWLVYLKDLNFDDSGNPFIQYVTSRGYAAGPENQPRTWTTARWTGKEWEVSGIIRSDNNYDTGSLYVEQRGLLWRLIAPTDPGPQPFNPGGEVVMWTSRDQGRSWYKHPMTSNSKFNHSYVRRPVNAHPEFYAFWADGHGRAPSESRLYFADQDGNVFMLPAAMSADFEKPQRVRLR